MDWTKTVFRLRELPDTVETKESAARLLSERLGDVSVHHIWVYSLATTLKYWEDPCTKVATVMFSVPPSLVQSEPNKQVWQIPAKGHDRNSRDFILDTHFIGLTPLNDTSHLQNSYNCIAISGLASHPFGSWQPKGGDKRFMWIRDDLAKHARGGAAILYGYDTKLDSSSSFQNIHDLAKELIDQLHAHRAPGSVTPLIFLAHSLGGLVVKQALRDLAENHPDDEYKSLLSAVRGAIFFGVPNLGMEQEEFKTIVQNNPNGVLARDLSPRSNFIRQLTKAFDTIPLYKHCKFFWAYETKESPTAIRKADGQLTRDGPTAILVSPESATCGFVKTNPAVTFPINASHSEMVKFSQDSHHYSCVRAKLVQILQPSAPHTRDDSDSDAQSGNLPETIPDNVDQSLHHIDSSGGTRSTTESLVRPPVRSITAELEKFKRLANLTESEEETFINTTSSEVEDTSRRIQMEQELSRNMKSMPFPAFTREIYISELADVLFNKVCSQVSDDQIMERLFTVLPGLLKDFALKIGHNAPSQMHRDVMVFIYRCRNDIVNCFKNRCSPEDESHSDIQTTDSDNMTLNERMFFWKAKLEGPEDSVMPDQVCFNSDVPREIDMGASTPHHNEDSDEARDAESMTPHLLAYRDFIFKSSAYKWLLSMLRRETHLVPAEPDIMENLRQDIIDSLPSSHSVSRRESAEAYRMTLTINWDPLAFFNQQGFEERPDDAVERAITLTGSPTDAQALTCIEYLRQTWPSTGQHTIQLVKDTVSAVPGCRYTRDLPDTTRLTARMQDSKFIVQVFGTGASVAEIGQQLAWLGAALRSSPRELGAIYCTPFISDIRVNDGLYRAPGGLSWHEGSCDIDFTMQDGEEDIAPSNGQCWHLLFRNPVVVKGYPIPRRPKADTGLEIPLNMMTSLAQTQRVTIFNQKVFIKGFSTMLVPTRNIPGLVTWHLIYNMDGGRISYLDSTVPHAKTVSILDLEQSRHILGWCVRARCYTGAAEANYRPRPAKLPKCPEGSIFRDISISNGKIVTGNPIAIGTKDTRIERTGYVTKLKWLYQRFVVLWDEDCKRGWLVNGTSALLHLLRASLTHDSTDKFKSLFLFKAEELGEASETHKAESAIEVLLSPTNRELKLYPENKDFIRLEHRIHHLYGILEQIIDYQYYKNTRAKKYSNHSRSIPREYLEGWNFDDLTKIRDPFYPRATRLEAPGQAWVSFTRDINAIVLFGRGFGELIRPDDSNFCSYWAKIPEQRYFLGACISDLKEIMDNYGGDDKSNPIQLTDNILWHTPGKLFGPCQCTERHNQHSDLIQVLVPQSFARKLPDNDQTTLEDGGAVIFGQNESFAWPGNETEDPRETLSSSLSDESGSEFLDSGIGCSQDDSSISRRQIECPTAAGYKVGIVCALPKEFLAMRALFDEKYDDLKPPLHDTNHYAFGRLGQHIVVAACLPYGEYGTNSAAAVVIHMRRSFTALEFCLLVGIGGGVPSARNDIRLGDVVISLPTNTDTGVVQLDLGKVHPSRVFERTGCLQRPPRVLLTAISRLQSDPHASPTSLQDYINEVKDCNPGYKHPGQKHDRLFASQCVHNPNHDTCTHCDGPIITRKPRRSKGPHIHYGLIASSNQVMKDAQRRDQLGKEHNILCFEMEAAGVMNSIPCLVIRGICDYADSHKNKLWQEYAAATAAAYAKLLLSVTQTSGESESGLVESRSDSGRCLKRAMPFENVSRMKHRRR